MASRLDALLHDAPTGEPESAGSQPPEALVAVLSRWSRYQVGELLGAGGGGFVWRAVDRTLDRPVALKFLRVDDAALAARLVREAQAQAKIDHPNVCKVYDAGAVEGRPYIAMQLVDGVTLAKAAPRMSIRERAAVMRDVAEAIHAAHRHGLIHRDLKPTNVMVERREDGWRAFVLDFGLVRQMETPGATASGHAVGTPSYMAPEQVRGESTQLDRRTDVYGLGATLYELLTGRPPFEGQGMEVMFRVLRDDPPAPRQLDPSLPIDLETIALKCLEKTPARRYPTAAALAAELERFLDGEPIEARRANLFERGYRFARRHRVLSAIALFALLNLAGSGVVVLRQRREAAARARIAQQFGRSLEQVQSLADRARLLPLHDVREENRAIRRRLGEIETQIGELGPSAEAAGHYAVGRGLVALRDWPAARTHLERAWSLGERSLDAALALGTALGEIYQGERSAALALSDPKEREARLAELGRTLRDPALERLRAASGAGDSTTLIEGLIALYEERYDDALRLSLAAEAASPWSWQAKQLVARTRRQRAYQHTVHGRLAEAQAELDAALPVLESAVTIARSDAALYDTACDHWLEVMGIVHRHNAPLDEPLAHVKSSCGASRTVDPDRAQPYLGEAHALDFVTQYQYEHGQDPRPGLQREIELTRAAEERDPGNLDALELEASAGETLGNYQQEHDLDPRPAYTRALELLDQIIAKKPSATGALLSSGNLHGQLAWLDDNTGRDPRASFDASEARFRRAHELRPEFASAWGNQGVVAFARGEWLLAHGQDPTAALRESIRCLEEAVKIDPATSGRSNLAAAWLTLARYTLVRGGDPTAETTRVDQMIDEALALRPSAPALSNRAEAALLRARYQAAHKQDARADLARAREAAERARTLDGAYLMAWTDTVEIEVLAAGVERGAALERARLAVERAAQLQPKSAQVLLARARLQRARAELGPQARALAEIDAGVAAARASLEVRDVGETRALLGALFLDGSRHGRGDDRPRARAELERALAANPFLAGEYGPLAEEARR